MLYHKGKFWKNLKVSQFYLGFLPDKNNKQIKHVQRVSLEFSESAFKNLDKSLKESENSDEMLWECSISLCFSASENAQ